jgi:hypothetical protein
VIGKMKRQERLELLILPVTRSFMPFIINSVVGVALAVCKRRAKKGK